MTLTKEDLWKTVRYLEEACMATDIELEELEKKVDAWVTIRPTDTPDLYDMWDGSVQLLANAPMAEIGHLMQHGGKCPMGCEHCPRPRQR